MPEKTTTELRRAAGEKRAEAQKKIQELQEVLQKQIAGDLDEDSRLSADEISQRKDEIEALQAEAKAIEGVVETSDVMNREDLSQEAKNIANEAGNSESKSGSPFGNVGEFLRAVRTVNGNYDSAVNINKSQARAMRWLSKAATRLERGEKLPTKDLGDAELKTLVGDDTGSTGRGDYLVPTEHMSELLRVMANEQQFVPRARRVPMNRRQVDFPRLAQTTASDTRPMFSFAAISKIAEGAQKPEREPVFEQLTLSAIKYAAYVEASDELITDSIVDVPPVLIELLTSAIGWEFDYDVATGGGSSEPQGIIGSSAEYSVARNASSTIGIDDIFAMEERLFGNNAVYFHHPSLIPAIYGLNSSNVIVWNPSLDSSAPGTLLGRPLIKTDKLPKIGHKGDIVLADMSFYLVGDLQRVTVANSIHYQFRNDVTAWRATFRAAGTPWPAGTFSSQSDGSTKTWEMSPFVDVAVYSS